MIERYVYVRLKAKYTAKRDVIAAHTRRVLTDVPGVVRVRVGVPADDHANAAWDLAIAVEFESLDKVEVYRVDPGHRAFVDEFLMPRVNVIKAWNFDIVG